MEVKKLTPFTFLNSINEGRKGTHLLLGCTADDSIETRNPDAADKQYVPFIINRGLSNYKDTVLCANEMNMHASLPPRMQYDFYRNIVVAKKRYSKWNKKPKLSEDIKAIQKTYNYSQEKAEAVYPLFNRLQISAIHAGLNKGGKV